MIISKWGWATVGLVSGALVAACSAAGEPSDVGARAPHGAGAGTGAGAKAGTGGSVNPAGGAGGTVAVDAGGANPPPSSCPPGEPNVDADGDGFTPALGDCRDCDATSNLGAYDVAGNGIDEDCSGVPDDEPTGCDVNVPIDGNNAGDALRALGICRQQQGQSWGFIDARWTFADGATGSSPEPQPPPPPPPFPPFPQVGCTQAGSPPNSWSRGLLPNFGAALKPRAGSSMLALSSGVARPGAQAVPAPGTGSSPANGTMCTSGFSPAGFPKDFPGCPNVHTATDKFANDPIALEVRIKVPTNARSCAFDVDFYTYEFPDYVCSVYNDFFVALLDSQHASTPHDANVSFDTQGNPISVNAGFVEVCNGPVAAGGKQFPCKLGSAELQGTGFEPGAATGWLQTTFPVIPGETITLRFAIWDMGDHVLDSSVLIDNFRCSVEGGDEPPKTEPIPR